MATGQFPNEGRFRRRQSPANGLLRYKRRLCTLDPSSLGREQYGSNSQTANQLALDYFWGAAAPAGVTGTIVETEAADTSTASGTVTVTGTIVETEASDTSSITATVTATGTIAETEANDTSTASGTVTSAGVTGTIAATETVDTSNIAATVTVDGTLAETEATDTASASGTITVTGAIVETEASDIATATGTSAGTEPEYDAGSHGGGRPRPRPQPQQRPPKPTVLGMTAGYVIAYESDDICQSAGSVSTNFDAELEDLFLVGAL